MDLENLKYVSREETDGSHQLATSAVEQMEGGLIHMVALLFHLRSNSVQGL